MTSSKPKSRLLAHLLKLAAGVALFTTLPSCVVHESNRQLAPGFSDSRVAKLHTFYVRKHGDDDYKLGEEFAAALQEMGYKATTGSAETPPSRVDATITYTDKWMWDITMYMISLDVQLREPGSDATLATAKTVRSSLIRKSQKEMVRETLNQLFKKP